MASLLECPKCGRRHRQAEVPGSDTFACLRCGARLKVPVAWRQSEAVPTAGSPPSSAPRQKGRRFRRSKRQPESGDELEQSRGSNRSRSDDETRQATAKRALPAELRADEPNGVEEADGQPDSGLEDDLSRALAQWDDDSTLLWDAGGDPDPLGPDPLGPDPLGSDPRGTELVDDGSGGELKPGDADGAVTSDSAHDATGTSEGDAGTHDGKASVAGDLDVDAKADGADGPNPFDGLGKIGSLAGVPESSESLRIGADAAGRRARAGGSSVDGGEARLTSGSDDRSGTDVEFDEDAVAPGRFSKISDATLHDGSEASRVEHEDAPAAEVMTGEAGASGGESGRGATPDEVDDRWDLSTSDDVDGLDLDRFGLDGPDLDGSEGELDLLEANTTDDAVSGPGAGSGSGGLLDGGSEESDLSLRPEDVYSLPADALGSDFFDDDGDDEIDDEESRSDRLDGFFGDRKPSRSRFGRLGRRLRSRTGDDEDSEDLDVSDLGESDLSNNPDLLDEGSGAAEGLQDRSRPAAAGFSDVAQPVSDPDPAEDVGGHDDGDGPGDSSQNRAPEIDLSTGVRAVRVLDEGAASAATTNVDPTVAFDATTRPTVRKRKTPVRPVVPDASIPLVKDESGGLVPFEPGAEPLPDRRRRGPRPATTDGVSPTSRRTRNARPTSDADPRVDSDPRDEDQPASQGARRSRSRSSAGSERGDRFNDDRVENPQAPRQSSGTRRGDNTGRVRRSSGGLGRGQAEGPLADNRPSSVYEPPSSHAGGSDRGRLRGSVRSPGTRPAGTGSSPSHRSPFGPSISDRSRSDTSRASAFERADSAVVGSRSAQPVDQGNESGRSSRDGGASSRGLAASTGQRTNGFGYTRPIGASDGERVSQMLSDSQRHRKPVRVPKQASPKVVTGVIWTVAVLSSLIIILIATWILGSVLGLAGASVFEESSVREIILGTDRDRFVSPLLFAVLWAVVAGSIAHVLLSRARKG